MQQLMTFIAHHWELSSLFLILLFLFLGLGLRGRIQGIHELSMQQATDLMNRADAVLLDVRDSEAFAAGHILGARSMPLASLSQQLVQLDQYKNKPIIVVCNVGQSSLTAASLLRKHGFTAVNNLTGGMTAWRAANLPVIKA